MTRVPGAALPPAVGQLASVAGMGLALVAGWWLGGEAAPQAVGQQAVVAATVAPAPMRSAMARAEVAPTPPAPVVSARPQPALPPEPARLAAPTSAAAAPSAAPIAAVGPCVLLRAGFGEGTAWLNPAGVAQVEAAGRWLVDHPSPVAVRGYADARGASHHNLRLSQRRARVVRDVLARVGVARAHMTVQALGDFAPLTGVAADDGRNRRVELWLPEGGCPPALPEEE